MTHDDKRVRSLLAMLMRCETGRPLSDADRAYKRGWRDALRSVRSHLDDGMIHPSIKGGKPSRQPQGQL